MKINGNVIKKIIKEADHKLLATERRDLMPMDGEEWYHLKNVSPLPMPIQPWTPTEAKARFLARHEELLRLKERGIV